MKRGPPRLLLWERGGESEKLPSHYSLFVIRYSLFIPFIICGFSFFYRGRDENLENFWEILGKFSSWSLKKGKKKFIIGKIEREDVL